jgi:hypothetical protein
MYETGCGVLIANRMHWTRKLVTTHGCYSLTELHTGCYSLTELHTPKISVTTTSMKFSY